MNTSLFGIKPSMFGQAKHRFRTGTAWAAHLECVMVLRDPKYQKSNKLDFWTQHLYLLHRVWCSLVVKPLQTSLWHEESWCFLTHQILVKFTKVSSSRPTNICQICAFCTTLLLELPEDFSIYYQRHHWLEHTSFSTPPCPMLWKKVWESIT